MTKGHKTEDERITLLEGQMVALQEQVSRRGDKGDAATPAGPLQGGELTDGATGIARVTLKGVCPKENQTPVNTVISKTNGSAETIRYPKNTGDCGDITLKCLDDDGRRIRGTEVTLAKGQSIRSYSTQARTSAIAFSCAGGPGACQLEFDR